MKRNWCAVYTKSNCEKKVAACLSKKGIKNYYPLNRIVNSQDNRNKPIYKPILSTIVFVYITDTEMADIKKTGSIINFVFWLGKPVVVKNDEILNMQYFTTEYSNIRLEKTTVNPDESGKIISEPITDTNEKPVSVKNSKIKLLLPSLGYKMVAEVEKSKVTLFNYNFEKSKLVS